MTSSRRSLCSHQLGVKARPWISVVCVLVGYLSTPPRPLCRGGYPWGCRARIGIPRN